MAKSKHNVDACIARLLYQLPLYQNWNATTLPKDLRQTLDTSDPQRLMCIVAYALQQLMDADGDSTGKQNRIA